MKDALEIMKLMDEVNYGWVDKDGNKHIKIEDFADNYRLQTPKELIESKLGVCWDQVELERYYFKEKGIEVNSYFIVYYDNKRFPCHTFISFEENNKFYWFEHAWERYKGIKEFNNEKELLKEVKKCFIELELKGSYDEDYLVIYKYSKPEEKLGTIEFYNYCEKGIKQEF